MKPNARPRGETMLQEMDDSEFGQFVAALWERQGWQAQTKRDDGKVFVAVQRPATDEEGLLWAVSGGGEVGGQQVQEFRSLLDDYDVTEGAVVTAGSLSDHAEKVAEGTGVELLDGEGITTVLERKGMTDLLDQFGGSGEGGSDSGGDAASESDDSPLAPLRAVGDRAAALVSGAVGDLPVSGTVVGVVVVVALLGAGVLFGPSLPVPFLGGGDGPVSAASASPANNTTSLHVAWNAKVTDEIDVNDSDGMAYYPPEGEQFVVVRLSVNNTGNASVTLKQAAFDLRTDEESYGHQELADHTGFVDFPLSPGTNYIGWTAFSVPEGTTGTLVYDQNETDAPVAVEFERDSSLAVNVTQV